MIDLSKCADCGDSNPQMYNCNKHGEPLPGFVCYPCWRNKHPVFNKPERKYNFDFLLFILPICLGGFLGLALYKIVKFSLELAGLL
jgi:hypothetical protein